VSLLLALGACAERPEPEAGVDEFRIAALSPAIGVILMDLGLEDSIVARHDFDRALSASIPRAGSSLAWDLEVLARADPTHLVFQKTTARIPDKLRSLAHERGWTLVERPLDTLDDVASCTDDLAILFGDRTEPGVRGSVLEGDLELRHSAELPSDALGRAWRDRGPIADDAGRVLILGSLDPPAAMGPGSFHHQLLERMGMTPAITRGARWIELDYEDIVTLAPDSIILFDPDPRRDDALFGLPPTHDPEAARDAMGAIADLPTPAAASGRLGVVDHPLALIPASSLSRVAEEIEAILESWDAP